MDSDKINPLPNPPPWQGLLPLNPEQIGTWRQNPMTALFLQFCRDYADQLKLDHSERWELGTLWPADKEDYSRGYLAALREMAGITADAINDFYQPETNETESNENADN